MRRAVVRVGLVAGVLAAVAACSSGPDPGPVFDNEGGREVSCMIHQTEEPGARYTDTAQRNTGETFALLRYYTANGAKPYCDGAVASEQDRAWGQVYVDLGGTREKVPTVLG